MPKTTNPLLRRKSTASPLKSPARKPSNIPEEQLDDLGTTPSLAPSRVSQDVQSLIRYIHANAFEPVPDRAAGMGSERISEVLRFRERLPRIVSMAHLHALSSSPTATERELAGQVARGMVRKVVIPGRGKGGAAVGEGVVLVEDWKARIREESGLSEEIRDKYLALMDANPMSQAAQTSNMSKDEVRELVQSGFFTSPAALSAGLNNLFASPGASSLLGVSKAGHQAPTGSLAAIGGVAAIHDSGGSGSMLATSSTRSSAAALNKVHGQTMTFSLPSTGAYLKLLTTARLHLLALLKQLSPRHREATWDLLREKWDGNTGNDATSKRKRERGEWSGILPGKTRRWREFWGVRFEWVLEECVGAGMVEVFDTGVGVRGVRAT